MKPTPKQPSLVIVLGTSCYLFIWSFILDRVFRSTDPWDGFWGGVAVSAVVIVIWLFVGLIPGLLIAGLYRWRRWRRFRTVAILFPGIFWFIWVAAGLVIHPETTAYHFKRFTGVDFPSSAREIRANFFGGGYHERDEAFLFHCTPEDTAKLIDDLMLAPDESTQRPPYRPTPEWPTFSTWSDEPLFYGDQRNALMRSYFLLTNAPRDQVYLIIRSH